MKVMQCVSAVTDRGYQVAEGYTSTSQISSLFNTLYICHLENT
jgi:hypothetical protein